MLLVTGSTSTLSTLLSAELAEVECRFAAELLSDLSSVNSLVTHVQRYHGKMLRPVLVLASGLATSASPPALTEAHRILATVVEMVHMATLVHDDVLDEAEVRRGGATLNQLRGNEAAVMLGDYLISHAYHLCSSLGDATLSQLIARTTNTVCEGELLQLANRDNWALDEPTYFEMIRRKTASLCGVCCRLGARLHGAAPAVEQALYVYGEKLGLAFQIVDDLLDILGQESTVGKTLRRDLQKGKLTLPFIHALSHASPAQHRQLLDYLQFASDDSSPTHSSRLRTGIETLLDSAGSIAHARAWAHRLVEQAKDSLSILPLGPARDLLLEMADAVLTRPS
ncbi:MAG: polyprenyl synthetase family protein [Phycisphaeraceae bacterium]|nr:polyprenyl synthetase family protein [Phycisphaeraceae bacterium]